MDKAAHINLLLVLWTPPAMSTKKCIRFIPSIKPAISLYKARNLCQVPVSYTKVSSVKSISLFVTEQRLLMPVNIILVHSISFNDQVNKKLSFYDTIPPVFRLFRDLIPITDMDNLSNTSFNH
ncbi:hypothetical protein VCUG_00687 [Vavraia culicis subsp. floridensis]|uniref:Uncharacterized protein n=1 Tax=Vavraia culicis (isolate floridensis) TaxID=948595 RepID=L2GXL0_VAVCU|nr:uncharacterized protein VCUG_00687 [Vavraia culicis subsp. floridensis]ELA47845.1 hypothetical protein VCUG_00687 [Vavraia culicis subsp. floridensis]